MKKSVILTDIAKTLICEKTMPGPGVAKMGKGLNDTDELIAMLTALGLKPGHIQCLTGKSSSQITNSKAKTNRILFADSSASSLYQNMVSRYGI